MANAHLRFVPKFWFLILPHLGKLFAQRQRSLAVVLDPHNANDPILFGAAIEIDVASEWRTVLPEWCTTWCTEFFSSLRGLGTGGESMVSRQTQVLSVVERLQ